MLRDLWVAYDGSKEADAALDLALGLARRGARVTVAHVEEIDADPPAASGSSLAVEALGLGRKAWRAHVAGIAARNAPDVELRVCSASGHPPAVLLGLLEWARPDLVVAGTHGVGGPWNALRGGVSQCLRHRASCPVLLVRRPCARNTSRVVVVGVDAPEPAAGALALGQRIALAAGARVHLVHVGSPLGLAGDPEAGGRLLLDWAAARLDVPAPAIAAELRAGDPGQALLAACSARRPLAVVVGRRPRSAFRGVIGRSVTDSLINDATCPVGLAAPVAAAA